MSIIKKFLPWKKISKTDSTSFAYSIVGVKVAEKMRVKLDFLFSKLRFDILLHT